MELDEVLIDGVSEKLLSGLIDADADAVSVFPRTVPDGETLADKLALAVNDAVAEETPVMV